nr:hypothetical protein [Angustibacter aerolatus]
MSGRPVDWATNAWQTALFVGLDAAAYGTFRVIEQTALGARFKQFVVGRPAADDAGAAGRSADDAGRSAGDDVARSGADDVGDAVPAVAGSVGGAGRSGATVTSRGALRPEAAQPPRIALARPASPSRSSTSRSSDGFEVPTRTGRLHPRTEPHPFAARPPRPVSVHRPTGRPPRESPPDRDGLLEHAAPSPSSRPRRFRPPPVPPSPRSGVRPSAASRRRDSIEPAADAQRAARLLAGRRAAARSAAPAAARRPGGPARPAPEDGSRSSVRSRRRARAAARPAVTARCASGRRHRDPGHRAARSPRRAGARASGRRRSPDRSAGGVVAVAGRARCGRGRTAGRRARTARGVGGDRDRAGRRRRGAPGERAGRPGRGPGCAEDDEGARRPRAACRRTARGVPAPTATRTGEDAAARSAAPGAARPEVSAARPEVPAARPDAPAARPEVPAGRPEVSAGRPEVSAGRPEVSAARPEVPAGRPEVSAARPDAPAARPEVSAGRPEVSAGRPEVSAARPEVSAARPEVSAARPEVPAARPEVSAARPDAPVSRPEVPAARPDAPAARPEVPAARPDAPAARPEVSAARLDAPVSRPGDEMVPRTGEPARPGVPRADAPPVQPGRATDVAPRATEPLPGPPRPAGRAEGPRPEAPSTSRAGASSGAPRAESPSAHRVESPGARAEGPRPEAPSTQRTESPSGVPRPEGPSGPAEAPRGDRSDALGQHAPAPRPADPTAPRPESPTAPDRGPVDGGPRPGVDPLRPEHLPAAGRRPVAEVPVVRSHDGAGLQAEAPRVQRGPSPVEAGAPRPGVDLARAHLPPHSAPRGEARAADDAAPRRSTYQPLSGREAVYEGMKEAVGTGFANAVIYPTTVAVHHDQFDLQNYAIAVGLGTVMAGTRQGLYQWAPFGQATAHTPARPGTDPTRTWKAPHGASAGQRWVAETPMLYAYLSGYFVLRDHLTNVLQGGQTPTHHARHAARGAGPARRPVGRLRARSTAGVRGTGRCPGRTSSASRPAPDPARTAGHPGAARASAPACWRAAICCATSAVWMPWNRPSSHPTSLGLGDAQARRPTGSARRTAARCDAGSSTRLGRQTLLEARAASARGCRRAGRGRPRRAARCAPPRAACLTMLPIRITFAGCSTRSAGLVTSASPDGSCETPILLARAALPEVTSLRAWVCAEAIGQALGGRDHPYLPYVPSRERPVEPAALGRLRRRGRHGRPAGRGRRRSAAGGQPSGRDPARTAAHRARARRACCPRACARRSWPGSPATGRPASAGRTVRC